MSTAALTVGDHQITAVYSGDTNNAAGGTSRRTHRVVDDNVIIPRRQHVTPATGRSRPAAPTTITADNRSGRRWSGDLRHDLHGDRQPRRLPAYSGDARFLTSTSATITQVVGPFLRPTTTVVTSNRVPANLGQTITFTATVRPVTGTGIPTGSVQFNIDGANVGALVTLTAQAGRRSNTPMY